MDPKSYLSLSKMDIHSADELSLSLHAPAED